MSVKIVQYLVMTLGIVKRSTEDQSYCQQLPKLDPALYNQLFIDIEESLPLIDSSLEVPPPRILNGTNCTYQIARDSYYISGNNCKIIPQNPGVRLVELYVQQMPLIFLQTKSFITWGNLHTLHVTRNPSLTTIEPLAFENLTKVENLTVTSNPNLEFFMDRCFEGLESLKELSLVGNKILRVSQIANVLPHTSLPNLIYIDLRENKIPVVGEHEFKPMENSSLKALILSSTRTEYIHEKAFNPLKNLVKIIFTQNKINGTVAGALINNLKTVDYNLNRVSLAANPLYNNQEPLLEAVSNSTITYLDISNTYFLELLPGFFPIMPHLETIDISNILISDFPANVINSTLMPRLKQLLISRNNLRMLTVYMALPTLEKLDLSYINFNNLAWNVIFKIDPYAFKKMPLLNWISFQGTRLYSITKDMFYNANNLIYMSLSDSSLFSVEDGSFLGNNKLQFLDLSRNSFPIFKPLSKHMFLGLNNLLALDLSYCHISNFPNDDVFAPLKSLQYISLRMNSLYQIDSGVFIQTPCIDTVDLRYNTLVSWSNQMFENNKHLNRIYLDYNHLSTLSAAMLKDFSSSSAVRLKGNSIICDCDLVNTVLDNSEVKPFSMLPFNSSSDLCSNPPNQTIVNYITSKAYTYECQKTKWPVVLAITLIALGLTTTSLFFIYRSYKLSIEFTYLTVKERLGLIKFRGRNIPLENLDGSVKDAFVSYSSEDESFVEKMVYILESEGFDLLLYKRDFNVGDIIPDRILESIESSRKTILVLSESFAKSEWCLWEMYIAQNRSIALIKSDQEPLLLIKKGEIDESDMTPTLKHLLKTRVYLQWHDSPFRQKIFWHQLKIALKRPKTETNGKEVNI